jgi:protein TonB
MQDLTTPDLVTSPVTSTDRFTLTLFFALVLHAMIILGITFGTPDADPPDNILPTLDITIANRKTPPPDEADYLAQTSQDGGGNVTEKVRPRQAIQEQAPAVEQQQPAPAPTQVVTADKSVTQIHQEDTVQPDAERKDPTAASLIQRIMDMVNLGEEINQTEQVYTKQPKEVYVSARTQEFKYANYMSEWVKKVERVGNLNYPDAARREGVSGKLLLDVSLNPDGSVRNITVLKSSGHAIIDEAAIRIVELAGPFPPFSPEISKEADILHITRTWDFSTSHRLKSH